MLCNDERSPRSSVKTPGRQYYPAFATNFRAVAAAFHCIMGCRCTASPIHPDRVQCQTRLEWACRSTAIRRSNTMQKGMVKFRRIDTSLPTASPKLCPHARTHPSLPSETRICVCFRPHLLGKAVSHGNTRKAFATLGRRHAHTNCMTWRYSHAHVF